MSALPWTQPVDIEHFLALRTEISVLLLQDASQAKGFEKDSTPIINLPVRTAMAEAIQVFLNCIPEIAVLDVSKSDKFEWVASWAGLNETARNFK